jgi:hypothetical protein
MSKASGTAAAVRALLALALVGCGSTGSNDGAVGGAAGNAANTSGTAGSGGSSGSVSSGGVSSGGSSAVGGSGGAGGAGGAGQPQAITLNFSWSSYWVKGSTKTPLTCADLGAKTVGFTISGAALESAEKLLAATDQFCESGSYQNYPLTLPPGSYDFGISLSAGLTSDANLKALLSGLASFTVAPGVTHVDIPEVKLVRITFPLKWTIQKAGSPSACDAVGADEVAFVLTETRDGSLNTISWSMPCTQTPAETITKPGTYDLTATLQKGDTSLATWAAPEKLIFSTESAGVPPAITFKVP